MSKNGQLHGEATQGKVAEELDGGGDIPVPRDLGNGKK